MTFVSLGPEKMRQDKETWLRSGSGVGWEATAAHIIIIVFAQGYVFMCQVLFRIPHDVISVGDNVVIFFQMKRLKQGETRPAEGHTASSHWSSGDSCPGLLPLEPAFFVTQP